MENYTAAQLAEILAITERRVNQLAADNTIKREADGKFEPVSAIEAFYIYKFRSTEKADYDKEHALLEAAKRERAEIELDLFKGSLISASDAEKIMSDMILTCKSRLLSIPARCATAVIGQKDLSKIIAIIKTEIFDALNELKEMPAPPREGASGDDSN